LDLSSDRILNERISKSGTSNNMGKWHHHKIIQTIPGKHEIKNLQTTAILGTAHILRKALT